MNVPANSFIQPHRPRHVAKHLIEHASSLAAVGEAAGGVAGPRPSRRDHPDPGYAPELSKPPAQLQSSHLTTQRAQVGVKLGQDALLVVFEFHGLIPHVGFVPGDAVLLQQRPVFVLKGCHPVVLLLIFDVVHHRSHIRLGDGKDPVARLPVKLRPLRPAFVNPVGGHAFHLLEEVRDGQRAR